MVKFFCFVVFIIYIKIDFVNTFLLFFIVIYFIQDFIPFYFVINVYILIFIDIFCIIYLISVFFVPLSGDGLLSSGSGTGTGGPPNPALTYAPTQGQIFHSFRKSSAILLKSPCNFLSVSV